ncbi:MAG: GCN5-related N-acetyltransferase [Acidobacteriaceae bacterium]|nr:GCN5-related N-acetyltransferase [Acidobacteriaceae bacterium]
MTVTDSPALSLRPIATKDAEAAAALSVQLGYEATPDQIRQRIERLAACTTSQAAFVACLTRPEAPDTPEIVGWIEVAITYHLQSEPFVLIGGLVVQDGHRGLGIGRRLCEHAENWTRAQGIRILRVTSRSTRLDAHRFYLRDGYIETKTSKVFEKILA